MTKSKKSNFKLTPQKGLTEVVKSFIPFLVEVNSTVSMRVFYCLQTLDFDRILSINVNPFDYSDAISFRNDLQCISFFKKCPGLPSEFNPEESALEAWFKAENSCLEFNNSLDSPFWARDELLHRMRKIITKILGNFSFDEMFSESRWGPGATTTIRGCDTSSHRKFNGKAEVTIGAIQYLFFAKQLGYYPHWIIPELEITDCNSLLFVPKTSKTHRPISVEPSINSFFQLGVGSMIRNRLGRVGIDLRNGQSLHRSLAALGSRNGLISTIDLSSASDTISKRLVSHCLPDEWFEVLSDLRSPKTRMTSGEKKHLEKFSSMGNGFTFELETLIFLSVILSTYKELGIKPNCYHVYGDDIIVDTEISERLISNLELLGFTINKDKTFLSGPFRESCGSDCFLGTDVRPLFLKGVPIYEQEIYRLVNGIRSTSCRSYSLYSCYIDDIPARLRSVPWLNEHRNSTSMVELVDGHRIIKKRIPPFSDKTFKPWYDFTISIISRKKKVFIVDGTFSDGEGIKTPFGNTGKIDYLASCPRKLVRSDDGILNSTLFDNRNGGSQDSTITLRNSNFHVVKRRFIPFWDKPFDDWV